jgi:hypothetical protein
MSKTFKIQPAEVVDHVTKDGRELTKLPYPFFVDEKGMVGRQDVWTGDPHQVIGFAEEPEPGQVDLLWEEVMEDPSLATDMYLVTSDSEGNFDTRRAAISSVTLITAES